jgi:hypothetical protein
VSSTRVEPKCGIWVAVSPRTAVVEIAPSWSLVRPSMAAVPIAPAWVEVSVPSMVVDRRVIAVSARAEICAAER